MESYGAPSERCSNVAELRARLKAVMIQRQQDQAEEAARRQAEEARQVASTLD
jgi:hypothetical protein